MYRIILLIAIIFSSCVYTYQQYANGDTYLWFMMADLKPTLFIWLQNRYFNLPVLLFSDVTNVAMKHATILIFYIIGFVWLIIETSILISEKIRSQNKKICTIDVIAIVLIAYLTLYEWRGWLSFNSWHGGPYAYSLAFYLRILNAQSKGFWYLALIALIGIPIHGMNPSGMIFFPALILILSHNSKYKFERIINSCMAILTSVAWLVVGTRFEGPRYGAEAINIISNTNSALLNIASQVSWISVAIYVMLVFYKINPLSDVVSENRKNIIACVLISLMYIFVVSNNNWVILNGINFRYFFPIAWMGVIGVAFAISIVFVEFYETKISVYILYFLIAAISFFCLINIHNQSNWSKEYKKANFEKTTDFIAGDFWTVVPMYYYMRKDGYTALPLTYRSEAISDLIEAKLKMQDVKAICVGPQEKCRFNLEHNTKIAWVKTNEGCIENCQYVPARK